MNLKIFIFTFILSILLGFSAFFSGSENALFSLSSIKLKRLAKEKNRKAEVILELLKNPRQTLITILFSNMLVNISISSISAVLVIHFLGRENLKFSILGVTFFIVIFGEILPKTIAMHHNEAIAKFIAYPISFLVRLLKPIRLVLMSLTDVITAPLTDLFVYKKLSLTTAGLKTIISIGHEEGYVPSWQKRIFEGYLDLGEKIAKELMIPRTEIFYVNYSDSFEELVARIQDQNFSRIPVADRNIDQIKGIIYTKDIIKLKTQPEQKNKWQNFIRPAYFIPETKKADELFKELVEGGIHLALVLDEYGGISGLVTLEDLLENIFISVKKPQILPKIKFLTPEIALISGNLEIKRFNKIFRTNIKDPYNETIAGFIISKMDRIPGILETFNWDNFSFLILKATPQKIIEIQVTRKT